MKHGKRLVALFMSLSLIANHTSTVIALGDEYKRLFIEQSLNAPNITWDTKDEVIVGTAFDSMKGVKAIDDKGNDITDKVKVTGSVDTSKEGEYVLTYSIVDSEEEPITRVVRVIPNPEFKVSGSDYVRTYKGEEFDYKQGLTVTDSKGNDITSSVTCEGNVDVNKLGSYNLKYYVPDKKEPILERTVDVIEKNVFNVYLNNEKLQKSLENYNNWLKDSNKDPNKPVSIEKDLAFSIYLDNKTSKFALENQSSEKLDVSIGDEVFANIKVFDKDNNEKLSIELLGSDTGNSEKLDKLKELTYEYGDYISIVTRDSKNCLDITGTLTGDIDNTKEDCKEYYSDGVDNLDYIKNVRFNIVKEGIKTVYNNAPEIRINGELTIEDIKNNDLLKYISIIDDRDAYIGLDEVSVSVEDISDQQKVVTYQVSDDWGRTTIKKVAVGFDISKTSQTGTASSQTLNNNIISVGGIEFADKDYVRFKIGFNTANHTITIPEQDGRIMNSRYGDQEYFRVAIYDRDGKEKLKISLTGKDRSTSEKLKPLRGFVYEDTDFISLWHAEAGRYLTIAGNVTTQGTDTTSGGSVNLTSGTTINEWNSMRLKLQPTGLVAVYNEAPIITVTTSKTLEIHRGDNVDLRADITVEDTLETIPKEQVKIEGFDNLKEGEQIITYYAVDSWGTTGSTTRAVIVHPKNDIDGADIDFKDNSENKVFSLAFDELNKQFTLKYQSTQHSIEPGSNDEVLTIKVFNKYGKARKTFRIYGKDLGNSANINALNGFKYSEGEYIQIVAKYPERIKVDANVTKEKEYSNVTTSPSTLANVRFQLGKEATGDSNNDKVGKFIAVYNEAPVINVTSETTIKRGDKFDPLNGVTITDDHDQGETAITTDKIIVSYRNYTTDESVKFVKYDDSITKKEGKYQILYKVKDSWGREGQQIAVLNVKDKTELENNSIELLVNDKPMITIGFDELEHKLKVLDFNERLFLDGNNADNMFEMLIYNSTPGTTQTSPQTIQIKYGQNLTKEDVQKINDISYSNTSFISFRVYDKSKLRIKGNIVSPENKRDAVKIATDGVNQETETYNNGFSSDDVIHNTYFKLSSDGLDDVYNNAPVFNGVTRATIIVGSDFDELNGVTVTDDHDVSITTSKIVVTGDNVTTKSSIGVYTVTYQVTDSMGRSTMVTRQVEVLPNYSTNTIEFYDGNTQKYRIGLNKYATGFEVLSTGATVTQTKTTNTTEYSIKVFDTNGYEINSIDLTGDYTTDQSELDELKKIQLKYGYRFSVWSEEVSKVKILGTVDKGNYAEIQNVNYNNITTRDSIDNVRFEITQDKTKAIYNKAPVLTVPQTPFEMYKGEIVDLTSGATITDDHDKLNNSDIIVEGDFTQVGSTIATFTVRDTWGRISNTTTRPVNVKKGMDRNEIILSAAIIRNDDSSVPDGENKYTPIPSVSIKFNTTDKTIDAVQLPDNTHNDFFTVNSNATQLINIKLYNSTASTTSPGCIKNQIDINGQSTPQDVARQLNNWHFEYGDWINMSFTHSDLITIKGQVVDAQQVYDPYVKISSDLEKTYFKITEDGLKAEYDTRNDAILGKYITEIDWYDIFAGNHALKIMVNTSDKTIKAGSTENRGIQFDNNDWHSDTIFTFKVFNASDSSIYTRTAKGKDSVKGFADDINNTHIVFDEGYYFKIEVSKPEKMRNMRIKNNLVATGQTVEDYTDGIDDGNELNYTRFYYTPEGVVAYNDAHAIFTGADDVDITFGDVFNVTSGVIAKNYLPADNLNPNISQMHDLTSRITVSVSPSTANSNNSIDTNTVGRNVITYTVTDDWGRTTTKERIVNVRPKLFNNRFEVFSSNNLTTPAFTIGFDNYTSKYTIEANSDDYIDESLGNQSAFKLWVIGSDGTKRAELDILGTDTAYSSEFNKLKNLNYQDGDYIKVWRNPKGSSGSTISTIKIQGEIRGQKEDYRDGIDNIDYMNNVVFKVSETNGLESIYNAAPEIHGAGDIIIKKGTPFNTTSGVTATDDRNNDGTTNVTINKIDISGDKVNSDRTGMYKVIYTVTDSWGRTTSKTRTVIVISNVVDNMFKVYKNSATNSGNEELAFTLGFGVISNKLRVYYPGLTTQESISVTTTPPNTTASTTTGVTITIYDRFGERLANVLLDGNNDKNDLLSLNNFKFKNNYMITVQYHNNPSKVKINGKVINSSDNTVDKSYEDGFHDEDEMTSVRFKITEDGLKEVKKQDLYFTGLTELKITRGDEDADLLSGVGIDGLSEELNKENIVIEEFDKFKIGPHKVTYSYTDSWGTTVTSERTIIVEPINELEAIEIKTSDDKNSKEDLFTVRMDTLNNKFYLDFVTQPTAFTTEDSVKLNVVELFDSDGNTKGKFEVTYGDIKDEANRKALETKVNQVGFEYGDSIQIKSYSPKNGFKIIGNTTGDITTSTEAYDDGVDNVDYIDNVRFKLTEDGLYTMYNHAPEFTEFEKTVSIFRSEEFDPTVGIEITDKEDGEIDPNLVTVNPVVDTDTIGSQEVTYTIADSWGRTTSTTRTVIVKSQLENNIIEIREGNKNSTTLFTINFDSNNSNITINKNTTTSNASSDTIITIYNSTGSTISTIELNGQTGTITKRDITTKRTKNIRSGQTINYEYGYYLAINSENASGVTIQGDIQKDNNKIPEDYKDGIDNTDYMYNVRFRMTQLGLEAIYNEAPKLDITNIINGNTTESILILDKTIDDKYDLLQGVTFSDDHDELTTQDIIITTTKTISELGEYDLTYEIIDSWGRSSGKKTRKIEIVNALQRNIIEFKQMYRDDSQKEGVNFCDAFNVKFNVSDKTLDVETFHTNHNSENFTWHGDNVVFFNIKITSSDGTIKYEKDLLRQDRIDCVKVTTLSNIHFEYGDKINIYQNMKNCVSIGGKVINGLEDYNDGVQLSDYLKDTTFIITEAGLLAEYKSSYEDQGNITNSISWNLGFTGNFGFRLKYDPTKQKIVASTSGDMDPTNEYVDTQFYDTKFRLEVKDRNGNDLKKANITGRLRPSQIIGWFNDVKAEYGGYFTIDIQDTKKAKNLSITGKINTTRGQVFEDFSNGIDMDDPENFKYIRFYFTPNGLLAYENEAPVVHGATDLTVIKGEPFDLSSGVTVTDDISTPGQITFSNNGQTFDQHSVGVHQIDYTATDSWGRSSVVSRFIFVTAKPIIDVHTTMLTIEAGSVPISNEDYIKSIVTVTDEEDDIENPGSIQKALKITDTDNFDSTKPGTYDVTYTVTDSDNHTVTTTVTIEVVRTINVSVPISIPFQIVTNLITTEGTTTTPDPFVSGKVKISNNQTSDLEIFVEEVRRKEDASTRSADKQLKLVSPTSVTWNNLSPEESMEKMALGIYYTSSSNSTLSTVYDRKDSPLWLVEKGETGATTKTKLGTLKRKATTTSASTEAVFTFTSKHGPRFQGGTSRGKFDLVFRFE